MEAIEERERKMSEKLLARECNNLLNEIKRLESELGMQEQRLKNVMNLVSYIHPCQISFSILVIGIQ